MKVTNVLEGRGLSVKLVPMLLWRALLVNCVLMVDTLSHMVSFVRNLFYFSCFLPSNRQISSLLSIFLLQRMSKDLVLIQKSFLTIYNL